MTISTPNNVSISYNKVINSTGYGINIQSGASEIKVFNNTVIGSSGHGINLWLAGDYNEVYLNWIQGNGQHGIFVDRTNYTIIYNNSIFEHSGASDRGIFLDSSSFTTIENNTISKNYIGIYLRDFSNNNTILYNEILNSSDDGVYIYDSFNNTIKGNNISYNTNDGIHLYQSDNNTIHSNTFGFNLNRGVYLDDGDGQSDGNLFYYNSFKNNTLHAEDDGRWNRWDYKGTGNIWDNYTIAYPNAKDVDDNDRGDTPYVIPGKAGSQDNFPIFSDGDESEEPPDDEPEPEPEDITIITIVIVLSIIASVAVVIGIYSYKNPEKVRAVVDKISKRLRGPRKE